MGLTAYMYFLRTYSLLPSLSYQSYCLRKEAHVCKQIAPGHFTEST